MGELLRSKKIATLALAIGLGAAACGGEEKEQAQATQPPVETTQPTDTDEGPVSEGASFTFDSLGSDLDKGGSNVIQVYAGPENTATDKEATGTYMDGQPAEAECKIEGREVSSIPAQGEAERTSNEWLKIDRPSGEEMWATAVYVENPKQILNQLEDC